MTNASSADVFYWVVTFLVGGGVPLITFITFWMTLASRITEAQGMARSASNEIEDTKVLAARDAADAKSTAQLALVKIELLGADLNLLKVDTSGRLSALTVTVDNTAKSLGVAEARIIKLIEDISRSMDSLSGTVTRTLGEMVAKRI